MRNFLFWIWVHSFYFCIFCWQQGERLRWWLFHLILHISSRYTTVYVRTVFWINTSISTLAYNALCCHFGRSRLWIHESISCQACSFCFYWWTSHFCGRVWGSQAELAYLSICLLIIEWSLNLRCNNLPWTASSSTFEGSFILVEEATGFRLVRLLFSLDVLSIRGGRRSEFSFL